MQTKYFFFAAKKIIFFHSFTLCHHKISTTLIAFQTILHFFSSSHSFSIVDGFFHLLLFLSTFINCMYIYNNFTQLQFLPILTYSSSKCTFTSGSWKNAHWRFSIYAKHIIALAFFFFVPLLLLAAVWLQFFAIYQESCAIKKSIWISTHKYIHTKKIFSIISI